MTPMIRRQSPRFWLTVVITILFSSFNSCSYLPTFKNKTANDYSEGTRDKMIENNMLRGIEYMRIGKYDVAMERLQAALATDPDYAEAHNAIAVLYEQLGQIKEAKEHFELATTLKPTDSDIHNNYGQFLCKQDQWLEADKHFLKSIENPLYRTPYFPYTNAALCALRNSDVAKAEIYLRKALQLNSKFNKALYWMAQLSYDQGFYDQAIDYLKRYLNEMEQPTAESLWLGFRLGRALNDTKAVEYYAQLLRTQYPDSESTRLLNQELPPR